MSAVTDSQPIKPKILIVDDSPDNLQVLMQLLKEDYAIVAATNGEKTLQLAKRVPVSDLILLDVMMPEIDGISVCRQIKAMSKWQAIPIIMVTALDSKADLARCLNAGADDFISKPINALELRAFTPYCGLSNSITNCKPCSNCGKIWCKC